MTRPSTSTKATCNREPQRSVFIRVAHSAALDRGTEPVPVDATEPDDEVGHPLAFDAFVHVVVAREHQIDSVRREEGHCMYSMSVNANVSAFIRDATTSTVARNAIDPL